MTAPMRIVRAPRLTAATHRVGIWCIDMFARASHPTAAEASLQQAPMIQSPSANVGVGGAPAAPPIPAGAGGQAVEKQPVTGFMPSDMNELAPDHLTNAVESFKAPVPAPAVEVDPLGALTEKERHAQDKEKERILQAQRDGDALLGAYRRR